MTKSKTSQTQATHTPATEPTSAAELLVMVENGDRAEAEARIKSLALSDFIHIRLCGTGRGV
jgi:hypothetical protein